MINNYITPITDRTWDDVDYAKTHQSDLVNKNKGAWNYTDCNRVCNNLKYAAEWMYEKGFLSQPYTAQIKTDWTETDIITLEQLNSMIVNNMNNLKTYSRDDLEWYPIPSIANMNYTVANWIELNIDKLATQIPPPPDTFRLTVENGFGSGNYEARTVVEINADTSNPGMVFDHWSGDHLENIGNPTAANTTYTMPNEDVTIRANYTSTVAHTLTLKTYTGTTTQNLYMGSVVSIEADPAPIGKVFHHWETNPTGYDNNFYEPAATTTFTMPNTDITITAVYITTGKKELRVTNGTGSGLYEYNSYASIAPSIPANATFTTWSGDTQYLTSPATQAYNSVKIPDVNIIRVTANYSVPPVTNVGLTVVNGVISSTGQTTGSFTQGNRIAITANAPSEGQVFTYWSKTGGGDMSNSDYRNATAIIGTSAMTVTAHYRTLEYYTLTVITNSGTSTSIKESGAWFNINANPAPSGQTFDRWTGNTSGILVTSASTGTKMGNSDRTITATYRSINQHTLTVKQLSGDVTYTQSEFSRVQIVADTAPSGKRFVRWNLSGSGSVSDTYASTTNFTFGNGDATLTPVYVNRWTVSVTDGKIAGYSAAIVDEGGRYELKCRSLAAYERFDGWTKTGPGTISNAAATNTYFTVGNGDATLVANISQYPDKTLNIYFQDPDTEEVSLVSSTSYRYGTKITGIEAPIAPDKTTFLTWIGGDQDINMLSPSALASTVNINSLTRDTSITATYFYPEAPEYYTLTVYNGYPQEQTVPTGSQIQIRANEPDQGYEFYKWYGDTQYIVNQQGLTDPENSIIMPKKSITLYAKYKLIGELPLFRVSVSNGIASADYPSSENPTSGVYIDVPAETEVTLTADADLVGWVFDYWDGNFEAAGVDDITTTDNPATFTMVESDLNITMIRRELDKYTVYPTNATGPGTVYPGTYPIIGNRVDTEDVHYVFTTWECKDADDNDCISAISNPSSLSTNITVTDKDLWATAKYTANYKLTVVNGQDIGDHYYYEGETVNSITADTPAPGSELIFDHWDDPIGVCANIYDPTPTVIMKDSIATITAVYTSTDQRGNSIISAGNDLHTNRIYRSTSTAINGLYAVGAIAIDRDGCIGVITEVDPDHNDNTDDFRTEKLFYGGNF